MNSLQTVYETIRTHFITQGKPALDNDSTCVYRAEDGSRCAVGVLILDSAYNPKSENTLVNILPAKAEFYIRENHQALYDSMLDSGYDLENEVKLRNFLGAAQNAHDTAADGRDDWLPTALEMLDKAAREYKLEVKA